MIIIPKSESVVNAAIEYASRGTPVFPCGLNKKPLTSRGFYSATVDLEQIRAWWKRWPNALIAMPTGERTSVVVIDVDVYKPEGKASYEALVRRYGLPNTRTSRTGGGGIQLFFKHPGFRVKTTSNRPWLGIDIRGDGGYVILPPSPHKSGRRYQWDNEAEPAAMPNWMTKALSEMPTMPEAKPVMTAKPQRNEFQAGLPGDTYAEKALNEECAALAAMKPNSGRNDALNAKAYRMGRFIAGGYLDREEVEARLYEAARVCGLEEDDNCGPEGIRRTIQSGIESGMQNPATVPALKNFGSTDFTDDTLALRLGAQKGWNENAKYVAVWKKWLFWDGVRWQEILTKLPETKVRDFLREIADNYMLWAENEAKKAEENAKNSKKKVDPGKFMRSAEKLREKLLSRAKIVSVLETAASNAEVNATADMFNQNPWLLCVKNGVIDLQTGKLREARREDYITKQAAVAYGPRAECPRWKQFLYEIMGGNENLVAFLKRAAGLSLTGVTSEHVLFVLHGSGRNGKSTFLAILQKLLGDYAITAPPNLLMAKPNTSHPTELATLFGRRLVVAVETGEGKRLDEAVIKQLTGGDAISTRRMHENFWDFLPTHKLWMATNHKPRIVGTDIAIWARVKLIPFEVCFEGREDKKLPAALEAELPGILNWCVEGCLEWQKNGLGVPEEVRAATDEYKQNEDVLGRFLEEMCDINPLASVETGTLYSAYSTWCERNGEAKMSQRTFGTRLAERGFGQTKGSHGIRKRTGLRLKKQEAPGGYYRGSGNE